jgi:hypothetical protein
VMKKNRPHTTKRRKRDIAPVYRPYSSRHTEEPLGIMMETWIPKEPQSPNPSDSAVPGRTFLFF